MLDIEQNCIEFDSQVILKREISGLYTFYSTLY